MTARRPAAAQAALDRASAAITARDFDGAAASLGEALELTTPEDRDELLDSMRTAVNFCIERRRWNEIVQRLRNDD